jgi:hypothetical protein
MWSDFETEAVTTSLRSLDRYEPLPAAEAKTFMRVLARFVMRFTSNNIAAVSESSDTAVIPAVPDTRPLRICDLPLPQFKALLESHKSRLAVTHGTGTDSALYSVIKEWHDLKRRVREQEQLRA